MLSDRIVVEITAKPGESFIDRMIALVEGASRQKTPNEIALNILLASLTIVFLRGDRDPAALRGLLRRRAADRRPRRAAGLPDPDHHRRAPVGHRHRGHGPAGPAQRAGHVRARGRGRRRREHAAAGQDRHDHPRQPAGCRVHPGRRLRRRRSLADAAQLSSLADETPEGRSIVVLAKNEHGLRERSAGELATAARSCRSPPRPGCPGVDLAGGRQIRKGAAAAVMKWVRDNGGHPTAEVGADRRRHLHQRRHAAGRGRDGRRPGGPRPGRHPPQGRRQGGHARALRGDAPHGHPHRHDHRRQPADRAGDRRGGRRRRLPRRGHARGQDGADPQGAGGRPAGRDDRRRHQRRPGAGPGRRRAWR